MGRQINACLSSGTYKYVLTKGTIRQLNGKNFLSICDGVGVVKYSYILKGNQK